MCDGGRGNNGLEQAGRTKQRSNEVTATKQESGSKHRLNRPIVCIVFHSLTSTSAFDALVL